MIQDGTQYYENHLSGSKVTEVNDEEEDEEAHVIDNLQTHAVAYGLLLKYEIVPVPAGNLHASADLNPNCNPVSHRKPPSQYLTLVVSTMLWLWMRM